MGEESSGWVGFLYKMEKEKLRTFNSGMDQR